jgi:hypothetical protein
MKIQAKLKKQRRKQATDLKNLVQGFVLLPNADTG